MIYDNYVTGKKICGRIQSGSIERNSTMNTETKTKQGNNDETTNSSQTAKSARTASPKSTFDVDMDYIYLLMEQRQVFI